MTNGNIVSDFSTHYDSKVMELFSLRYKLHANNFGKIPSYQKMSKESKKIQNRIYSIQLLIQAG